MRQKLKGLPSTARDWWFNHPFADWILAGGITTAHGLVVWRTGSFDFLGWAAPSDRRGAYSAAAVVISLTGTFGSAAVSQLGSGKGDRIVALKREAGRELADSWRSIFLGAFVAALIAIVALVLDVAEPSGVGHNAAVARWAFEFGLLLAVWRFLRLGALFHPVIVSSALDDADSKAPVRAKVDVDVDYMTRRKPVDLSEV